MLFGAIKCVEKDQANACVCCMPFSMPRVTIHVYSPVLFNDKYKLPEYHVYPILSLHAANYTKMLKVRHDC